MIYPIPKDALDDRLAIVGTAGSGKTYAAGTAVERILKGGHRAVIVDPLGVWYGLRLVFDGQTASPFNVVIFGGPHGDLPITEHAGALIGETVAGMAESCILDLSALGTKAAERRFMLGFLTTLYRKMDGDLVHLVIDEADMFAPQQMLDKEGELPKLVGMMETIVRRGRVRGFIPWLITQRPAVLSKNVLSQADGLIAFKLTSSQDRDAIGDWVQGQADKAQWKEIWGSLATMQQGQGLVWIPGRGVLSTVQFPEKVTFDSSRAPKRGEKRRETALKPLDLGKLKDRLSTIEAETKANDPRALKAEIAVLRKELANNNAIIMPLQSDPKAIEEAERRGFERGVEAIRQAVIPKVQALGAQFFEATDGVMKAKEAVSAFINEWRKPEFKPSPVAHRPAQPNPKPAPIRQPARSGNGAGDASLTGPQRKLMTVLAQYPDGRTKKQLAILAGYAHSGGAFNNPLARCRVQGLIVGGAERLAITDAGLAALGDWDPLPTGADLREYWLQNLPGPPAKLLRALCEAYPDGMDKATLAKETGYEPTGGAFNNPLARLRSLELVTGRGTAEIRASEDLF